MESKIFKCDECGQEFELDYQLEMHTKFAHGTPSAYTCGKCGQEFSLQHQLDIHLANVMHDPNEVAVGGYRGNRSIEQSRKLY